MVDTRLMGENNTNIPDRTQSRFKVYLDMCITLVIVRIGSDNENNTFQNLIIVKLNKTFQQDKKTNNNY